MSRWINWSILQLNNDATIFYHLVKGSGRGLLTYLGFCKFTNPLIN